MDSDVGCGGFLCSCLGSDGTWEARFPPWRRLLHVRGGGALHENGAAKHDGWREVWLAARTDVASELILCENTLHCRETLSTHLHTRTYKHPRSWLSSPSAVSKKHGKLITFLRTFMKSRPTKQKLKQRGILRERVFGCDLGEHLLNSGHDGEPLASTPPLFILNQRSESRICCRLWTLQMSFNCSVWFYTHRKKKEKRPGTLKCPSQALSSVTDRHLGTDLQPSGTSPGGWCRLGFFGGEGIDFSWSCISLILIFLWGQSISIYFHYSLSQLSTNASIFCTLSLLPSGCGGQYIAGLSFNLQHQLQSSRLAQLRTLMCSFSIRFSSFFRHPNLDIPLTWVKLSQFASLARS